MRGKADVRVSGSQKLATGTSSNNYHLHYSTHVSLESRGQGASI